MQFYATIRKKSKYAHQQPFDNKKRPIPFKVYVDFYNDPLWPVKGGIGTNYRLFDVDLWIVRDGKLQKLPVHSMDGWF
jgi:hypothetical protein